MARFVCPYCEEKIDPQSFCPRCGQPTKLATHDERVLWELGQWEASRRAVGVQPGRGSRAAASVAHTHALVESARSKFMDNGGAAAPGADAERRAAPSSTVAPKRNRRFVLRQRTAPADALPAALGAAPPPPAAPPPEAPVLVAAERRPTARPVVPDRPAEAPVVVRRRPNAVTLAVGEPSAPASGEVGTKRGSAPTNGSVAKKVAERTLAASKREKCDRRHKRHRRRVGRQAASLDLKDGERVSLSLEGWSRLRRATLVVTNYRVALVTRFPVRQVRWIPLEDVESVRRRWHGTYSLTITGSIEVLTLQKARREVLASFGELLESEVREARAPGGRRHHPDIVQEWCDRSSEVWDSFVARLRLWIRQHPAVVLGTLSTVAVLAYLFAFGPRY